MKKLLTFLQSDGTYRYRIMAPDFVADREERSHYEKDRFASMEANLKHGDILFDVGTELAWQSAIYARFVGPEHMCLFEHCAPLWPTIRQTWEANEYAAPLLTYCGFVSNRSTQDWMFTNNKWPHESDLRPICDFSSWKNIHTDASGAEITLDEVVRTGGDIPSAITIDVEGAELRVLQGALKILEKYRPLVWVSIHPELRLKSYDASKRQILSVIRWAGYETQYLGVDHEEHFFCFPRERAESVILVDSPWMTNGDRAKSFEEKIPHWQDSMGMPYTSAWGK